MGKVVYLHNKYKTGEKKIMRYDIKHIANELLKLESMTHKKLQKLCYYVQAMHLAIYDEPLINTYFEAWVHGPVSPELYSTYKNKGMSLIEQNNTCNISIDSDKKQFIKLIHQVYGNLSANELENLTHTETPWINARKGYDIYELCTNVISEEDMRNYYSRKLSRGENER